MHPLVEQLYREIEHGDEKHRAWLREKLTSWDEATFLREAPSTYDEAAEILRIIHPDGAVGDILDHDRFPDLIAKLERCYGADPSTVAGRPAVGNWTTYILTCHKSDRRLIDELRDHDDHRGFTEIKPEHCVLQFALAAGAVKNLGVVESIAQRIEALSWRFPESVILLIEEENDVRPAVWGFAGARCFGSVNEPRKFVCLVPAVPS